MWVNPFGNVHVDGSGLSLSWWYPIVNFRFSSYCSVLRRTIPSLTAVDNDDILVLLFAPPAVVIASSTSESYIWIMMSPSSLCKKSTSVDCSAHRSNLSVFSNSSLSLSRISVNCEYPAPPTCLVSNHLLPLLYLLPHLRLRYSSIKIMTLL